MAKKSDKNEEKTYEVKDKRRVDLDGNLKEEAAADEPKVEEQAAEQAQEAAPEPEPKPAGEQEPIAPPDVYALLGFMTGLLADTAWQFMGMRLAPGQKETVRDLAQAKIAIDTIIFIEDKLHPKINDEERRALRGLISDLQINFVQHSE